MRNLDAIRFLAFAAACVIAAPIACGGEVVSQRGGAAGESGSGGSGGNVGGSEGSGGSGGAVGGSGGSGGTTGGKRGCSSNSDCATEDYCVFPIGSCDTKGSCISAIDAGPACGAAVCSFYGAGPGCEAGATVLVCGCGKEQMAGCGWSGGASGPTTGDPCPTGR
jgi:hypothetical protein